MEKLNKINISIELNKCSEIILEDTKKLKNFWIIN